MNPELEKVKSLAVDLHGRRVGIINRLGGDRHLFAFEQDYIDDANRPTLSEVVYTPIDIIGGGAARCYGGRTCTNWKR
jgi:hypothetical protein